MRLFCLLPCVLALLGCPPETPADGTWSAWVAPSDESGAPPGTLADNYLVTIVAEPSAFGDCAGCCGIRAVVASLYDEELVIGGGQTCTDELQFSFGAKGLELAVDDVEELSFHCTEDDAATLELTVVGKSDWSRSYRGSATHLPRP